MNINFEKSEYNYYATILVFGQRSPKVKNFSAFVFDAFKKHKDLSISEYSGLNPDNRLEIKRHLMLGDIRLIESSHTSMSSGINNIVSYIDKALRYYLSDSVFSDDEFEYYEQNWDVTVQNKIRTLGVLIQSIHERKVQEIPLLINEFPNITKTLLNHSGFWEEASDETR